MRSDFQVVAKPNNSRALRLFQAALMSGTMLTAVTAGSMLLATRAMADCTVNQGVSPDTINCTNADTNGANLTSVDATGVNVTMQNGSFLTNGAGTSLNVNMVIGPNFNFTMLDPNSSITGSGTQINTNTVFGGGTQNWTIDGNIKSTGGNAIVDNLALGGNVNMVVGATGQVQAANNAISINSVAGSGDVTVTNNGQVYAGNNAISITKIVGTGTIKVNNDGGVIGTSALAVGGTAVNILGVQANADVENINSGSIYSKGTAVNIDVGGTSTVNNTSTITSLNGTAISSLSGDHAIVNNVGGEVHGGTGGISVTALSNGVNVDNTGGTVTTTNGTGIFAAAVSGDITVSGDQTSKVTSTNGPGILAVGGGNVTVDSGTTSAGAGGVFNVPGFGNVGGGVIGVAAAGGDAKVTTHGDTTVAAGGLVGVGAVSLGGEADVTLGGNIDPPQIGGAAIVIGGTKNANLDAGNHTVAADNIGLLGLNTGTGQVNIKAADSTVTQTNAGLLNAGIAGLGQGAVDIQSGKVTAAGSGVFGLSTNSTSTVTANGQVDAKGVFGIASIAGNGDATVDLNSQTVTNENAGSGGLGVLATSLNGNAIVKGEGSTVASDSVGITSFAINGNANVDSGLVTSNNNSGVLGIAINGGANITTHDAVTANGAFGVFGTAVDLGSGSGDVAITLADGKAVTNTGGIGVSGLAIGGNSDIEGATASVNAKTSGVISTALNGNSTINLGAITAANGSAAVSTAIGGDSNVTTNGLVQATNGGGLISTAIGGDATATNNANVSVTNGLVGVSSLAIGGDANTNINADITGPGPLVGGSAIGTNATVTVADGKTVNATGLGLTALSAGGDAKIQGANSTVNSGGTGAVSTALGGDSTINLGAITAANGSAAVSTAIGGDSNVTTYGLVQATNGGGLISTAIGGDANATSNANVSITNGLAGVAAFAINGDATAQNNAEVSVTNGFIGVGAVSIGGDATATANGNIDPPFIGVSAFTIGSGTAHSIVNDNMSVQANGIGVFGGNIGTGTVDIDVGNGATVSATPGLNGVGIAALKLGDGNVTIDVGTNTTVTGDSFGVTALALGSGNDTVAITNQGTLTNRNGFIPTIFSITDGGTSIDNQSVATIENGSGFAFSPIIATIGGQLTVNNTGTMIGSMSALTLNGGNNVINNNYGGEWTTSGLNFFATGGDNVINNNPGGHINSLGFSVFAFADGGTSTVNNSSEFFVNGVTSFIGLENFNNAGGQLDMQDGHTNDATFMTGNFNGGPNSKLAIDAQLGSNSGFFLADFLGIGGNTTPGTGVKINDTTPYTPGSYNPDGVIFSLVAGNTANGDFYSDNGPIDKGLFSYDVFLNPDFKGQGFDAWVIASTPDATFFELPHIVSAAQSMWNQSTGVWLDRTADLRTALMGGCSQVSLKDESGPCAPGLKSAVWAKGWGFNEDRDRDNSFELHDRTLSYNIDSNQTGFGVVGGIDLVRGREVTPAGNSAWVIGVLGGYTHSDLDFHRSTTDVNFDGGTVGAYATYLNGGWFVDSKFSADIGNMDYSNSTTNLHASDSSDFASYGFTIDGGYRTNIGFGTFIEPGATLSYVATNVDSIKIYGSNVDFDNGNSLRGRLGVRVGTSFISDSYRVEPFLGIAGWYEFEGDNQASVTNNGYTLTATDDLKGLSGDLSGGVNLFTLDNSGTSAFAKGDFTFGQDNLIGVSGQIGVRVGW